LVTAIIRRSLILLLLVSLFLVSICFGDMRVPGDWRFRTSFNRDWRFQDSGVAGGTIPQPARIYDNGAIAKIFDNGMIFQIFKYWQIREEQNGVIFLKANGDMVKINP